MMNPQGIESNVQMTVAQPNPKSRSQLKYCAENNLLSKVFRFHFYYQKVIGLLGIEESGIRVRRVPSLPESVFVVLPRDV